MRPIIEIQNMYKIYNPGPNAVHAIDGVSLKVERGEFLAIVGQSGSGKSTFINMLGCLDVPTSGHYFLNGEDVAGYNSRELSVIRNREIGFIFQSFYLISSLTAYENVELPLIYARVPAAVRKRQALEALAQVGLTDRMHHKPKELSGGQQQRAAIARALATNPPVLLADEPTGNLDSKSGQDVLRLFEALHAQGHTVILITHDHGIAQRAFRIVTIQDGRIIQDVRRKKGNL